MELIVTQEVKFLHSNEITIKNVTEVLLALDGLAKRAAGISTSLDPRFQETGYSIHLRSLKSGSLLTDIASKFFTDPMAEALLKDFNEVSMAEFLAKHQTLLMILFGLLAFYGWKFAAKTKTPPTPTIHIERMENYFLDSAKQQGHDPDQIRKLISHHTQKDKASLAKQAISLVSPFRTDPNAALILGGSLEVGSEVLREIPETMEDVEYCETYENARIEIRAMDMDRGGSGWGAVFPDLPGMSKKRLRMAISNSINLDRIAFKREVIGNVLIHYKTDDSGKKIFRRADLIELS